MVEFVPANIKNSADIIDILKNVDSSRVNPAFTFISLDVVSLYPSIPIEFGLDSVSELAERHWSEVDTKGLTVEQLMNCLRFICYNYEVQYKEKVYKQLRGCPMGAHFAPPFAIITMSKIESQALSILEEKFQFSPVVYKRYIDDIILGPMERDDTISQNILNTFNSINESIKFTIDVPKLEEPLVFLDLSISLSDRINYSWYVKPCHSNNSLKSDSWVPSSAKANFIRNSVSLVSRKCSSKHLQNDALLRLGQRFEANGYGKKRVASNLKKRSFKAKEKNDKASCLILDFISDGLKRKVSYIIKKYDFNVRVINKPAKSLAQAVSRNHRADNPCDCNICKEMPQKYKCSDRFLVYKFTCNSCGEFYIGQTSRPFQLRFKEHMSSIEKKDNKSALSQHVFECHNDLRSVSFKIDIIKQCSTPLETRLSEAQAIDSLRPSLNRKHERPW